jgi:hypothetical protein
MATELSGKPSQPVQVLGRAVRHDVAILRPPYDAPRPERQASNEDESNVRMHKADEQLVKGRRAHGLAVQHRAVRTASV